MGTLVDKKLEFYAKVENEESATNEGLKCYDYRTEWENFKKILEENL